MTDNPDIAHRFDKFTMPCDIPDDAGEAGNDRSTGGLRSPASQGGGASGAGDYGVPTQDWLSRGLKSKAGRGWEAEASHPDPDPDLDDDPYYGLSYDYGQDPRSAAQDSAGPGAKTPYDHYPSSAALLQAQRARQMGGSGRKSAAPHWPGGWQPGDPPREIVLDTDPVCEPGDPAAAALEFGAKFGPAQQVRFLDALSLHGNVRAAAARVGVSRDTVYRTRRRTPGSAQLWEAALVIARGAGEAELATRAFDGVATPVFVRGEHVATWRRHDPRYLLTHLARLDRRIGQNGGACGGAEQDAQIRAGRFDELLAALAGQPVPDDFAHAAQVGARLAAEDFEHGGRETGEAEPRWLADVPPTRAGVFGLACDRACAAHEEALAAGRKDYRDVAAQDRGEARAVERATTAAVARWERWREEGRALLDRVLAGAEAGEEAGEEAGDAEGDEAARQGDASGAGLAAQGDGPDAETAGEISGLGAVPESGALPGEFGRESGRECVSEVSEVSTGPSAQSPAQSPAQAGTTPTYIPTPIAEATASTTSEATTTSSSSRLSRRPRRKASARKASRLAISVASEACASPSSPGGGAGSGHSIPISSSSRLCTKLSPSSARITNLRCAK
jgi:hypothetical protein